MDLEFAVVAKALENLFEHADCIARHLFAISQRGRAFSIPLVDIFKTSSFKKSFTSRLKLAHLAPKSTSFAILRVIHDLPQLGFVNLPQYHHGDIAVENCFSFASGEH